MILVLLHNEYIGYTLLIRCWCRCAKTPTTAGKEIEAQLGDKNLILNSFIISNTPYKEITHWKGQENIQDFNTQNVYFQKEQQDFYVKMLLEK